MTCKSVSYLCLFFYMSAVWISDNILLHILSIFWYEVNAFVAEIVAFIFLQLK